MIVSFVVFLLGISECRAFIIRQSSCLRCSKVFERSSRQHDSILSALEAEIRRKDHVTFGKLLLTNKIQPSGEDTTASDAPVPDDMVFLLLLNALQRSIKPGKKRLTQSTTLLSTAQDAGVDRVIIDVCFQVLCIATNEHATHEATASSRGKTEDYLRYYNMLRERLVTYTHFWDSVRAVQTEVKQRPNWLVDETNRSPLDLVTSLAVVDALVKDLSFGLLAMQICRSAGYANPTTEGGVVTPTESLYVEAYHFLQHIITHHQSLPGRTNSAGNRAVIPPLHEFVARTYLPGLPGSLSMDLHPAIGASETRPTTRSLALASGDDAVAVISASTAAALESEDRRLSSVVACTGGWPHKGCFIDALFACNIPSLPSPSPSSSSSSSPSSLSSSSSTVTPPVRCKTRVLVLGDGDLSFSASLSNAVAEATSSCPSDLHTQDHRRPGPSTGPGTHASPCMEITATTLESSDSLYRKYASARANHLELLQPRTNTTQVVLFNIDATKLHRSQFPHLLRSDDRFRKDNGRAVNSSNNTSSIDTSDSITSGSAISSISSSGGDDASAAADENDDDACFFDTIVFNFPFADTTTTTTTTAAAAAAVDDIDANKGKSSSSGGGVVRGKVAASSFDTHWVARRRHMELLGGMFRSARSVLNPRHGRIFITLLLSQAQEWNVEELGQGLGQGLGPGSPGKGYRLETILPFESGLFEHFGYRRKRTYNDDSFPLGAANAGTNGATASTGTTATAAPGTPAIDSDTILRSQRGEWARGSPVGAWTFVFRCIES